MAAGEAGLAELVRTRGAALVGYAYLLCGDRGEAEDLVQDALVKTFSRGRRSARGGADDVANLEGYVRRAVLTTYVDGFRRRRRWLALRHLAGEPEQVADHGDDAVDRDLLAIALRELPRRERTCVVLRFYEDWTVAQIADALSLSQGSVKRYLSDGVHRLEDVLGLLPDVPQGPPGGGAHSGTEGDTMTELRDELNRLAGLAAAGTAAERMEARIGPMVARVRHRQVARRTGTASPRWAPSRPSGWGSPPGRGRVR